MCGESRTHGVVRGKNRRVYLSQSTIIEGIIELFKDSGEVIALAAPTGRAAQRMGELSGVDEAKTIHRLLEYDYDYTDSSATLSFKRNADNPLEADIIIIDESSMLDIQLFSALLEAIPLGKRLVLVGDADQLPSVGPGNVLSDLIESQIAETVYLKDIHRREQGSIISYNAHEINQGNVPQIDNQSDFMLVNKNDEQVALETIVEVAGSRMSRVFGYNNMDEIQVISPVKRGTLGTISLNAKLQQAINPPAPGKREHVSGSTTFREGDKVMQIKNNYNLEWENPITDTDGMGVFNGDIGVIEMMDGENFVVRYPDGKLCQYTYKQFEEISHAYAITVHKSQGSEFKAVIMPLLGGFPEFLNRRLLYTAVTRAKEKLMLVGQNRWFGAMVQNDFQDKRRTLLKKRIKDYQEDEFYV